MNATLVHLRRHIMEIFKCIHLAIFFFLHFMVEHWWNPAPLSCCALSHFWLTDRRLWLLRAATLSAAERSSLINEGHTVFLTTAERLGTNLTEFWISSSVTSTTEQWSSSRGRGSAPPWVTHGSIWKDMDSSEIGQFIIWHRGTEKMHNSKYSQFTSLSPSSELMANTSFSTFTGKVCFKLCSQYWLQVLFYKSQHGKTS